MGHKICREQGEQLCPQCLPQYSSTQNNVWSECTQRCIPKCNHISNQSQELSRSVIPSMDDTHRNGSKKKLTWETFNDNNIQYTEYNALEQNYIKQIEIEE